METFDIVLIKVRTDGVAVVNWLRADLPLIANALTLHERGGADVEILGYYPNVTTEQRMEILRAIREAEGEN
jgi:hypothetical protein